MIVFAWWGFPQYAARCVGAFVKSTTEKVVVVATRPAVPVEGMEKVCGCPVLWIGEGFKVSGGEGCKVSEFLGCKVSESGSVSPQPSDYSTRQQKLAAQKVEGWLTGVSRASFNVALESLVAEKASAGEYRFKRDDDRRLALEGARRFFDEFSRKVVTLSDGRCVYFAPDMRSKCRNGGDLARCWAEYAFYAVSNGGRRLAGKNYNERWFHPHKAANFGQLVATLKKERCFVRFRDDAKNDTIMFLGDVASGLSFDVVTRLDEFGNMDANLTEVTFEVASRKGKKLPRLVPLTEAVQAVVHHQTTAGSYPQDDHNIPNNLLSSKGDADNEGLNEPFDLSTSTLIVSGWAIPAFNELRDEVRAKGGKVICMNDGNYRGLSGLRLFDWVEQVKQMVRAVVFRMKYRKLFDGYLVPGKSGRRLMRFYGVPDERIAEGMYSADESLFDPAKVEVTKKEKRIVYVGQYIDRKNVLAVCQAFEESGIAADGWTLEMYGSGPLKDQLPYAQPFVQPEQLPAIYRRAKAFILASKEEHWGLVVHEAALSGCYLMLSNRVGAAEDLLGEKNGVEFDPFRQEEMTAAFRRLAAMDESAFAAAARVSMELGRQRGLGSFVAGVNRLRREGE